MRPAGKKGPAADVDLPEAAVAALLREAGLGKAREVRAFAGGGNNRVYLVETEAGRALLKRYFAHARDLRDRLGAEVEFCRFAWRHGVRALPEPMAADTGSGLALFEYVEGRRLEWAEVTGERVEQAWAFFREVNRYRGAPDAGGLPAASEACFSLEEHLETVARRVARLRSIEGTSEADEAARRLVSEALAPAWERVRRDTLRAARRLGVEVDNHLAKEERRLSPSDFGFHNALLQEDGRLRFLDFEYAGWDDPAKAVCDFFCQVAVPVPAEHWDGVARAAAVEAAAPEREVERYAALLPVYRVKWVCIVLNEFLAVGARRRAFAAGHGSEEDEVRKERQLALARAQLAAVA